VKPSSQERKCESRRSLAGVGAAICEVCSKSRSTMASIFLSYVIMEVCSGNLTHWIRAGAIAASLRSRTRSCSGPYRTLFPSCVSSVSEIVALSGNTKPSFFNSLDSFASLAWRIRQNSDKSTDRIGIPCTALLARSLACRFEVKQVYHRSASYIWMMAAVTRNLSIHD
jgi:hypothetical protein